MAGRVRRVVFAAKRFGRERRKAKDDRRQLAFLARFEQLILPSISPKSGEHVYEAKWVNETSPKLKKRAINPQNIRTKEKFGPTVITRQGNFVKKVDYYWVTTERRQNNKRKKK